MRYYFFALLINLLILSIPIKANNEKIVNNKIQISIYNEKKVEKTEEKTEEKKVKQTKEKKAKKQYKKIKKINNKNIKTTKQNKQNNKLKNNIKKDNNTQNENICANAILFYDLENNYPKKAIKLSLYGRYAVKINFSIDKNKNIKIIKAVGKEPFLSQAKKAILKINYKIKNPNFTLCEYEKIIIYELK